MSSIQPISNTFLNNSYYSKNRWEELKEYRELLKKNGYQKQNVDNPLKTKEGSSYVCNKY